MIQKHSTLILSLVLLSALNSVAWGAAPTITSASSTTFTIGQQCPEIVLVGVNDDPSEVGTPCPFTVTTSGTPTAQIILGGVALPSGVYFNDNGDGTGTLGGVPAQGTAGTYALTFMASNSMGTSTPQAFTLTINTPPVFISGPFATPSIAVVGQPITFIAGAFDADGNPLTYQWNFGEGSSPVQTGATVTNTYNAPGTYLVYIIVTDTASAFIHDQLFVTVNAAGGSIGTGPGSGGGGGLGGGNEDSSVVGMGPDSDGDGFSDLFESAVGSDPSSPTSTPTGHPVSAATLNVLTVSKASIKLNFANSTGDDTISFAGSLPIPAGFNPDAAKVLFDVGGVVKTLTLNAKGTAINGGDSMKLAIKARNGVVAAQTAKYTVAFDKGSFATSLAEGTQLVDTTIRNAAVTVKFTIVFNGLVYQIAQPLVYTAKFGKSGVAK